jgi:hypothetical protein
MVRLKPDTTDGRAKALRYLPSRRIAYRFGVAGPPSRAALHIASARQAERQG